jgi:hypothetical protein
MVRIVGDENLSDDERVAAIQGATGVSESKARAMLAQSRGEVPTSDVFIVEETRQFEVTATQGVAVLSFSGEVSVAERHEDAVVVQG